MNIKSFFEFVEIRTKLASLLPFTFGTIYTIYDIQTSQIGAFHLKRFILMLLSLLFIDMCTTSINNYIDYKKSNNVLYKNTENAIGIKQLDLSLCKKIIFLLLFFAILFGLLLAYCTSLVVLIIGALSFCIGIFYTFGPFPISRTPFGEIFSGFFMGFVIIFLSNYIHNPEYITLQCINFDLTIYINLLQIVKLFIISLPFTLIISNIMLANNICDMEMDAKNNRFLLPYYIGKENALKLYQLNYYIAYLCVLLLVITGIFPIILIVTLVSFFKVNKNISIFMKKQSKQETFVYAVKNLMIFSIFYITPLLFALFFQI